MRACSTLQPNVDKQHAEQQFNHEHFHDLIGRRVIAEHRIGMSALALLPGGTLLSAGLDGSLTSWNVRAGKILRRIIDACPGPMQVRLPVDPGPSYFWLPHSPLISLPCTFPLELSCANAKKLCLAGYLRPFQMYCCNDSLTSPSWVKPALDKELVVDLANF